MGWGMFSGKQRAHDFKKNLQRPTPSVGRRNSEASTVATSLTLPRPSLLNTYLGKKKRTEKKELQEEPKLKAPLHRAQATA